MAIRLPFINKYPYTSFEAVNIDWLLNQVSKIPVLEDKVNQHETRIITLEDTAADHEQRLQAAEGDIDALKGRMDDAEADIDQLQDDVGTAQADITNLKGRMTDAEADIDSLEGRMDSAEGDIDQLQTDMNNTQIKDQQQDNDIAGLDSRVTTLEGQDKVIANPGGTGANLNTISIDDVTYVIPSGGGGGGGSSVTPNPAGTPTATLNTVDIDGTVYDMPVDASDINQINSTISALDTRVETLEDTIGDTGSISRFFHVETLENTNTVQDFTDQYSTFEVPYGAEALVFVEASFDTTNFGSTQRSLGVYIRKYESGGYVNEAMSKYTVYGSEPAMITQSADFNLITVLGEGTYHIAARVNASGAYKQYHVSLNGKSIILRKNPNA